MTTEDHKKFNRMLCLVLEQKGIQEETPNFESKNHQKHLLNGEVWVSCKNHPQLKKWWIDAHSQMLLKELLPKTNLGK